MQVGRRASWSPAPFALALVLTLAGSASPALSPKTPARPPSDAVSATTSKAPPASVTRLVPRQRPDTASSPAPEPAIHVGAVSHSSRAVARADIADMLLSAYRSAAASTPASCHLPVSLLAAIGEVESGSLVDRPIDKRHRTSILGPVLNGHHGYRAVPDTDGGRLDGNATWDRAVGPMQFIPSTWRAFGVDGDGDGVANPQDVEDAAATSAAYLCYGGRDLARRSDLRSAVLAYNASGAYVALVLTYQKRFADLGLDHGPQVVGLSSPVADTSLPVTGRSLAPLVSQVSTGSKSPAKARAYYRWLTAVRVTVPNRYTGDTQATGGAAGKSTKPAGTGTSTKPPWHTTGASGFPTISSPTGSTTGATGSQTPTPTPTPTPTDDPTDCTPVPVQAELSTDAAASGSEAPATSPAAEPTSGPATDAQGGDLTDTAECPPPCPASDGSTGDVGPTIGSTTGSTSPSPIGAPTGAPTGEPTTGPGEDPAATTCPPTDPGVTAASPSSAP